MKRHGFDPRSWKIPCDVEQISLCAKTYSGCELQLLKFVLLEPVLYNKRSHCNDKPKCCSEEWPLFATTQESRSTTTKTQCSQKNKLKKKFF